MSFVAKLQRAREVLEQQGRLSVRALARELDVAGDELDELITELVDVQRVALREGAGLVWENRPADTEPALRRPAPDPRSYTPKHLAEKILQSKSALEGERKQVTVLFTDVKGSLELAEQLDAEQWHRILERFFEILTDCAHHVEGTVNHYTRRRAQARDRYVSGTNTLRTRNGGGDSSISRRRSAKPCAGTTKNGAGLAVSATHFGAR